MVHAPKCGASAGLFPVRRFCLGVFVGGLLLFFSVVVVFLSSSFLIVSLLCASVSLSLSRFVTSPHQTLPL